MKIYIDSDCKCHVTNDGTMQAVETDFFDGKCDAFIEGYRIVPAGESWTRSDGSVFVGEMIAPWKPYSELDSTQRQYEQVKLAQYETENIELKAQQNELVTSYNEGVNSI